MKQKNIKFMGDMYLEWQEAPTFQQLLEVTRLGCSKMKEQIKEIFRCNILSDMISNITDNMDRLY